MSRIIYPSSFDQQLTLLQNVKYKHDTDGNNSVLQPFLLLQKIDLDTDGVAGTTALAHEHSRLLLTRQSQNLSELRDIKFDPAFNNTKNCLQFLKSLMKPNFKALTDWGAPIDTNGKITYPSNIIARSDIFNVFKKKYDNYQPGQGPLASYLGQNNIDLVTDQSQINTALDFHQQFLAAAKAAENETEQRDLLWLPVNEHLHQIGDYLKKFFGDNTKNLGLWGFTVDSSPRAPKERISKIKPGDKVIVAGIVLGSTLTNIGKTDIHIYAGKSTTGNPVIVHTNEAFGIAKGYSVITVSNPSNIETAQIKALITP